MAKKKIQYKDIPEWGSVGRMKKVNDFLPAPHELVLKKPHGVKVTMMLDKHSIDFFKDAAQKHGGSYQNMIRTLLYEYVDRHHVRSASL